jgi:hypothetical protein
MSKEIWKTVIDFNNYEVSNIGNVRKKECEITYSNGVKTLYKEKLLKGEITKDGYIRVTLSQNNVQKRQSVHRLVADLFIPKDARRKIVNHIDGVKDNNHVDNLEWCTTSENEIHSYSVLGKINPIRKLSEKAVLDILTNCIKGTGNKRRGNVCDFMSRYSVSRKSVLNVYNRKTYV